MRVGIDYVLTTFSVRISVFCNCVDLYISQINMDRISKQNLCLTDFKSHISVALDNLSRAHMSRRNYSVTKAL